MRQTIIKIMGSVVVLIIATTTVFAQNAYKGDISINPEQLKQCGDSLNVLMRVNLNEVKVDLRKSVDITPVLSSGEHSIDLPKISIKGRNDHKNYVRSMALMNKTLKADYSSKIYKVEKGYRNRTDQIDYSCSIPFEPWMADAHLDIKRDDCGCGNSNTMGSKRMFDNVLTQYQVTPYLAYIKPEVEIKHDVLHSAELCFAVNCSIINSTYTSNEEQLATVDGIMEKLKSDSSMEISKITILGFASPEGTLAINKRLSEGRAIALKNYMISTYNVPKDKFEVLFGGENWNGLVNVLTHSDYNYKDDVLALISSTSSENIRKELKEYKGGVPYRQLLNDVYPLLRTASCSVEVVEKLRTLPEIMDIYRTTPENLSLNELYMVANQYENGSEEFNNVFQSIVKKYPNDQTSNINLAVAALRRMDFKTAEQYLSNVKSKVRVPEYDNAMGVLEMLKGDYDKADSYLQAAKQAGVQEAILNINELNKKLENLEQLNTAI